MIEKLKVYLKRKYDYDLNEYKICTAEVKKNKFLLVPVYLYIFVLIGYAIQALGVIDEIYNLTIVIIVGVLFGMYQVLLIQRNKQESIVVTPVYIIKCLGKSSFEVVMYDEIRKFAVTDKNGLTISDKKSEINFSPVYYRDDLPSIVEILEAKGKTFDKTKEFMKRPVVIRIINNEIVVRDLKVEESSTEKLVGKYYKEFQYLTPGFIRDVLFLNTIVQDVVADNNNLIMYLDKIEVKEGHPENTGFESIAASDCIVIFENIKIKAVTTRKARERGAVDEALPSELETIVENIEKGVITNWKYKKNAIDLIFASGTNIIKVSFDYKEVIIGWKSYK